MPEKVKISQTTKVDLTEEMVASGQVENLAQLEELYRACKAARKAKMTAARQALRSAADAQTAAAQAQAAAANEQKALADFFDFAAKFSETVAEEPIWLQPYKKGENIILESPMTSRDARKAARLAHSQVQAQAKDLSSRFGEMFGGEQEDEEEEKD
jgi:hypothetical protein